MTFFDLLKRQKEAEVKDVKSISASASDYILKSTRPEQISNRSGRVDLPENNTQEEKPFKSTITPAPVGRAVRAPSHIPTMGESVLAKYNSTVLY